MNNNDTITLPLEQKITIPNGYKKSAIGVIPMDWEVKKLGEIGKFQTSSIDKLIKENEELVSLVNYMNVYNHETINNETIKKYPIVSAKETQILSCNLLKGDILFTPSSETPEDIGHSVVIFEDLNNAVYSYHLMRFRPIKEINILYSHFFCNNQLVLNQFTKFATGSTRFTISVKTFSEINVLIPPLTEQQKIAEILSTWDEAIANYKNTINSLKTRNKGLAQHLLDLPKSSHLQLSKVIERVKKPLAPEPNKLYRQIGIRSHSKGIFYKEEIDGLSLGNKSVFYIEPHCFILNIVFAWEQAIAKTTKNEEGMIASHRFPMYKPLEDKLDLDFLLYFFKSKKGKYLLNLASPGGAGRNKTLGQNEFLKLLIPVPDIKKQKYIVEILETANQELKSYEDKLKVLQLQKKGLMQQLLTGKLRVNVN